MSSRLKNLAASVIARMTGDANQWGDELTFIAPGGFTATVFGMHTKHHLGVDAVQQKLVNTKNAHCSVKEDFLTVLEYPLRNADGIVDLAKHKVQVKDSTGTLCTYMITENFPDETVGFICCILSDWEA